MECVLVTSLGGFIIYDQTLETNFLKTYDLGLGPAIGYMILILMGR